MTRPWRPAALAVFLCALPALAGCGGEPAGAGAWSVEVDTLPGGAVRVVSTPPAGGFVADRVVEEELRIGSMEGDSATTFARIKGLAVLDDGRIVVLDALARELRVFGADGTHLATWGGAGEGPGQLQDPYGLMRDGAGRLWVPDVANARMSVFDADSGFVRSHGHRPLMYGWVWAGTMTPDGRVLEPSITIEDRRNVLRVYDGEMTQIDSLPLPDDPVPDLEDPPGAFVAGSPETGMAYFSVPFYPRRQRLVDPRGDVWTTGAGDPSYRVARWTPGGDTSLVIEARREPVPVTEAERDSLVEELRAELTEYGAARQDWSKIPGVKPAVTALFLSEESDLWVEVPTPDSLFAYDVFGGDGRHTATAVTSLDVYAYVPPVVRGDTLWAVVTDELDVQYVVRALVRPAG